MSTRESHAPQACRSCVVCRQERSGDQLLQLGHDDGVLRIGRPKRGQRTSAASRRSAWVCVARECLAEAGNRVLSRSLKRGVRDVSGDDVVRSASVRASRALYETLGLARRLGVLDCGADASLQRRMPGEAIVVANDASPRTAERANREGAVAFGECAALGHAVGGAPLAVLRIRPGRLAADASYWLRVWQQTSSPRQTESKLQSDATHGTREVA